MKPQARHPLSTWCLACAVMALAGCAASVEVRKTPQLEAATEANVQAHRLYAQGDYTAALRRAQHAYAASASVENEEGIAASLLNLSMISQRLEQPKEARQALDRILNSPGLIFSSRNQAEAAFRRAVLAANDGDRAMCESLLKQVDQLCAGDCPLAGKQLNLRAQLAIEDGRMQEAMALAAKGLAISEARRDAEEEANALRLGANAMIHLGDTQGAMRQLNMALLIDKRLGLSKKIFRDLLLMGITAQRSQQSDAANAYLSRAREVALTDNNNAGVTEVDRLKK